MLFAEMNELVEQNAPAGFRVDLDYYDAEGEEPTGKVFSRYEWNDNPRSHFEVLEQLLNQLAESLVITDVSTDGDNHDCEAIFHVDGEGWLVLKIR